MFVAQLWRPLLTLVVLAYYTRAQQTIVLDQAHNYTTIVGTWSSGSMHVRTGPGFANPANLSFTYPKTTGVSYSFTDDLFFEVARYRFQSNGSEPNCVTGIMNWSHGKYDLLSNGSIVFHPNGDGFQQIQDPCAPVSNFIENYNITELYQGWRIFYDGDTGDVKLHLYQFDGSPLAPQFRVSATPNMLPTAQLRNVTPPNSFLATTTMNNASPSSLRARAMMGAGLGAFVGSISLAATLLVML